MFFRLSFRSGISCVFNCEEFLCINFFIPQFQYVKIIYLLFQSSIYEVIQPRPSKGSKVEKGSFNGYFERVEPC